MKKELFKDSNEKIKILPVKVPIGAKQIGNYILGKSIGIGAYAKVYAGLHIPTGQKVAVKIIEKIKLSAKDMERVHREISILKKIVHSSVINLYEIIETEKSLLLITEYVPGGELFNYILQKKRISENEACQIFQQVIRGVQFLHHNGITHRDLKPENILIDFDGRIKIIDFGLSNTYQPHERLKTECGSPCYAAPEMIEGKHRYNPLAIDIWSLGITLYAMLCGCLPFVDPQPAKLYRKILSGEFKFPNWVSEQAKELITMMLQTNPQKRPSLNQILEHPWLNKCQPKWTFGIDTQLFKIPFSQILLSQLKCISHKSYNIEEDLENNEKNKETACYYLALKKLIREGYKFQSYVGCDCFNISLLKSKEPQQQVTEEAKIQVEAITVMNPDNHNTESPLAGASIPSYTVKSIEFHYILKQFLTTNDSNNDPLIRYKKQEFYINMKNQKKKESLKLEPNRAERANILISGNKNKKPAHSLTNIKNLGFKNRKNILSVIHRLSNDVINPSQCTSFHKLATSKKSFNL